jgi:cytochrome c oxidase assembly protein subunit 15
VIAILLGAVAGTVGWIMVQSGLKENTVLVNPVNLMSHILVATIIVGYVLRVGIEYLYPKQESAFDKKTESGLLF